MSLKFCPKCNYGTPQADVVIKFCCNCGYNFISASMPKIEIEPIKTHPRQIATTQTEENEEEYLETSGGTTLEFEPPELELDIPKRPKITIGTLATDKSAKENIQRPKLKKMNKKQFEEEWSKDVSESKNKSKEIGI